jgi:hypothetical protein
MAQERRVQALLLCLTGYSAKEGVSRLVVLRRSLSRMRVILLRECQREDSMI